MPEPGGRAVSSPLMGGAAEPTLRELSAAGGRAWSLPELDVPTAPTVPEAAAAPPRPPAGAEPGLVPHLPPPAHTPTTARIPVPACGSNPASLSVGAFRVRHAPSDARGMVDLAALRRA